MFRALGSAEQGHILPARMVDRSLFRGLVRIHLHHHAAEGPIFGLGMIRELRRHGYPIGAGTLYLVLHGLENRSYLSSVLSDTAGKPRRAYRITPRGRRALREARLRVAELFHEVVAEVGKSRASPRRTRR